MSSDAYTLTNTALSLLILTCFDLLVVCCWLVGRLDDNLKNNVEIPLVLTSVLKKIMIYFASLAICKLEMK